MNSLAGVWSTSAIAANLPKVTVRYGHTRPRFRVKKPELTHFPPGWGEQIWVFNHWATRQIIYSHNSVMDSNRALRQLPFNGKKTKPAKLRKDYWTPMALIQFPKGLGVVGQNVFQKLREFRRLHELSWEPELWRLSKKDRGAALNDQKANSVADLAAVLAGAGAGNKIVREVQVNLTGEPAKTKREWIDTTIYWADERDRYYAKQWTANVTHELGIPLQAEEANEADDMPPTEDAAPPSEAPGFA